MVVPTIPAVPGIAVIPMTLASLAAVATPATLAPPAVVVVPATLVTPAMVVVPVTLAILLAATELVTSVVQARTMAPTTPLAERVEGGKCALTNIAGGNSFKNKQKKTCAIVPLARKQKKGV